MNTKGFTLVETMVAITIITLAVAGPMFAASRAVVAAQGARYQLIASHLAQEGIEYVRLMRDNEYLATRPGGSHVSGDPWDNFLNGSSSYSGSIEQCRTKINSTNICTLDPVSAPTMCVGAVGACSLQVCPGGTCTVPLYLTAGGIYTQQSAGNTKTVFTRTIQTYSPTAVDERIDSKVSWNFHGTTYLVTVSDHLTQWQ
ncbi:hypothetical protein COT23_01280 [Candidatus Kaiserbacteria bacterium CG08_land_8_20_14_0_20_50_21]|uniref:Uncharacterized protein n=1 Tax=Candidatus Kaiserbacteria bacterium CG08_land_8_20_14_0_20_50_21 TaxID=1974604 RepID=A0A2H0YY76_9BACT|nr:MAG: hypothetical protein COT23_01280 [Candidatus Kaiserbacteria bacterium CG08_land_8_20_14_0_20_50_21]